MHARKNTNLTDTSFGAEVGSSELIWNINFVQISINQYLVFRRKLKKAKRTGLVQPSMRRTLQTVHYLSSLSDMSC